MLWHTTLVRVYIIFLLVLSGNIQAQQPKIMIDIPEGPVPWTNLNFDSDSTQFQFAIVTDRTGGHRAGVFMDAINKLNLLHPEFVMSIGDLIEGYTTNPNQLDAQWEEFNTMIAKLKMPFFYVPGNHDLSNKVMSDKWLELYGRSYYSFIYQNVLFLCLNSEDNFRGSNRGSIDEKQFEFIRQTLAENPDVRWTLLFMHQPLWEQSDPKKWPEVEHLLEGRNYSVVVGHIHRYSKTDRQNAKYFVLATTGGGSALRGVNYGEFDEVVWVTMTKAGPVFVNLLLNGIWDENVHTPEFANRINELIQNYPVTIEPLFVKNTFKRDSSLIAIQNNSDFPLKIQIQIISNACMTTSWGQKNIAIEPHRSDQFILNIDNISLKKTSKSLPLKVLCQAIYEIPDRPALQLNREVNLSPQNFYPIASIKKQITIDGNLQEWHSLPFSTLKNGIVYADPFSHQNKSDGVINFAVGLFKDTIFVAAKIIDDEIETDLPHQLDQDAVTFTIDPTGLSTSANLGMAGSNDELTISASPVLTSEISLSGKYSNLIKAAFHKETDGYTIEMGIPCTIFDKYQQGNWQHFRLNAMVVDSDQNGHHKSKIFWQPDWNSKDNILGSGMFVK